ncbi:MAG: alpha/beta fold hydrolase [Deltaproteobacteria bacterium]|nr:alpha/beta fold hydrolase [Deltaproteobacteria bacterium]
MSAPSSSRKALTRSMLALCALSSCVWLAASACSSSSSPAQEPAVQPDASDAEAASNDAGLDQQAADAPPDSPYAGIQVLWEPCSLYEGADDGLAECATVSMPLYWRKPDGRTIGIRAKRLKAKTQPHAQMWLLHGGPGASGVVGFPSRMERWREMDPGLELYTLDHRGTGFSRRLGCPNAESATSPSGSSISVAEAVECIPYLQQEYGDELGAITTTDSSMDLAALIEATRMPGKKVIVWGGSYGTYFAQRYLQVAPAQADGVIIEGIATPMSTFINYDELGNKTGKDFFGVCAADAFCASKLGPDPWARLGTLLQNLQNGHCSAAKLSRYAVSQLLAYMLYYHPSYSAAPATIYRLERCSSQDVAAVSSVVDFFFGAGGVWDIQSYSILLQHHISLSEMWMTPAFEGVDLVQYFEDIRNTAYVAKFLGPSRLQILAEWPVYNDPAYDNQWPSSATPMLMMQGRLDPATSWYEASNVQDHYTQPSQTYVEFPNAPHGVSSATPLSDAADAEHCGMRLLLAFAKDPKAPLDTSCVSQVLPINFKGTAALAQAMFGTSDFWDDPPASDAGTTAYAAKPAHPSSLRAKLQQQLREQGSPPWMADPPGTR